MAVSCSSTCAIARASSSFVFHPEVSTELVSEARKLRFEFVIGVRGRVELRPDDAKNPKMKSGMVEVSVLELDVMNPSLPLPIQIDGAGNEDETLRLYHRYLDLRRPAMTRNLLLRNDVAWAVREYLRGEGFVEIETPCLTKSTPEGAREYLVPSRVHPGRFYALPQSPQLFKQLLMIAGFDRYYQIVRCFRDEDLRSDRQPEFTQIDMELSFVEQEDIYAVMEGLTSAAFAAAGVQVQTPLPRLSYPDAMRRYGIDRPDTRFGLELVELSDVFEGSGFGPFDAALGGPNGLIAGIVAPGAGELSRKRLDELPTWVSQFGAGAVYWVKPKPGAVSSSIKKALDEARLARLVEKTGAGPNDLILMLAEAGKSCKPGWPPCACAWPGNWGSSPKARTRCCGSRTSRCSIGTTRSNATRRYTTRSRRPGTRTCRCWIPTRAGCARKPTIWSGMVWKSPAARSASIGATCRRSASRCFG